MAKQNRELLRVLVANYPQPVPLEHLINQLWGLDPNGGPEHPVNIIRVLQHRVNDLIRQYGFKVVCTANGTRALIRIPDGGVSPTIPQKVNLQRVGVESSGASRLR